MIRLTKEQILMLHTQLIDLILDVADGKKEYEDILSWILKH